MASPRVRKIADRIQVIVAEMLERRIKDPRLGFVTITEVRLTGDSQQATIFYTVLGDEAETAGSAAALESAKGVLRSEVGKQLGMRHVPSLTFILMHFPMTLVTSKRSSPPRELQTLRWPRRLRVRRTPGIRTRQETTTKSRIPTMPRQPRRDLGPGRR